MSQEPHDTAIGPPHPLQVDARPPKPTCLVNPCSSLGTIGATDRNQGPSTFLRGFYKRPDAGVGREAGMVSLFGFLRPVGRLFEEVVRQGDQGLVGLGPVVLDLSELSNTRPCPTNSRPLLRW